MATREELIIWLKTRNYIEYRPECWAKEKPPVKIPLGFERFKMTGFVLRYEFRGSGGWIRLHSGYFSKLSISENNKLSGMEY